MNIVSTIRCAWMVLVIFGLVACGGSGGGGGGSSSTPGSGNNAPTAIISAPLGTQHATTVVEYALLTSASDLASIAVEFSTNGGINWSPATRATAPATAGDGTTGLTTSPSGTSHTFFWASATDGVALAGPNSIVRVRITPSANSVAGTPTSTADFTVNNNFNQLVGIASNVFDRNGTVERTQEVAIGNLIADAARLRYGTQLVLIGSGSIRTPLPSSYAPTNTALRRTTPGYAVGPPYDLVMGDVYAVLPFGNRIVTRTVTGAQLWSALEHGVFFMPSANGGFPQISGFSFTYKLSNAPGARIQSVALTGGASILPDATTYTLALLDFTNSGGDGYTMFADGAGVANVVAADVLLEYIQAVGTISPTTGGRITQIP